MEEAFYIDPHLYHGRPVRSTGPDSVRTPSTASRGAGLLRSADSLGILYDRVDHAHADTIEACHEVEKVLGWPVCKNLFLCNRQKTQYYLLMLEGDKVFKDQGPLEAAGRGPAELCRDRGYGGDAPRPSRLGDGAGPPQRRGKQDPAGHRPAHLRRPAGILPSLYLDFHADHDPGGYAGEAAARHPPCAHRGRSARSGGGAVRTVLHYHAGTGPAPGLAGGSRRRPLHPGLRQGRRRGGRHRRPGAPGAGGPTKDSGGFTWSGRASTNSLPPMSRRGP